MTIARRKLVRSAAAGMLAAPAMLRWGVARAAEFTIRMGIDSPPAEPTVIECDAAGEKIKERTNGAVEFSMFPSSALGAGTDMIAPVRSGAIEGYFFTSAVIAVIAPNAAISGIPLAFKDYPTAWAALDGDLGNRIKSEIRAAGLEPMNKVFDIGFRQIATQKRIDKVDDLAGIKMRVPQSPLYVGLFRALGVLPATLNYADVYPALQTKVVEGMEGPIVGIWNSKMYEVTKFVAITNHMWDGFWLTHQSGVLGQAFPTAARHHHRGTEPRRRAHARQDRRRRGAGADRSGGEGHDDHHARHGGVPAKAGGCRISTRTGKANSNPRCGRRWNRRAARRSDGRVYRATVTDLPPPGAAAWAPRWTRRAIPPHSELARLRVRAMTEPTAENRVRMTVAEARALGEAAMRGAGFDDDDARILTDHVLDAALCGYEYSGLPKLLNVVDAPQFRRPRHPVTVTRESGPTAVLDGGGNNGMIAAFRASEATIERAAANGLAIVSLANTWMTGRSAYYCEMIARAGFVVIHTVAAPPAVAPFGGTRPALGTNPIAFGFPTEGDPLVIDMGTSAFMGDRSAVPRPARHANPGRRGTRTQRPPHDRRECRASGRAAAVRRPGWRLQGLRPGAGNGRAWRADRRDTRRRRHQRLPVHRVQTGSVSAARGLSARGQQADRNDQGHAASGRRR